MALVGCVEAPTGVVGGKDDGDQGTSLLGDNTTGIFDVVAFGDAGLRISSPLRYAPCSAYPCKVTPSGLVAPLSPAADGYLVAGTLAEQATHLRVDAVYRGTRTWGDGSGDLYALSMTDGTYRACALPTSVAALLAGGDDCRELAYVVTNIAGQAVLADALAHGEVWVRATPAVDAQAAGYAHLGMVYVREDAGDSL